MPVLRELITVLGFDVDDAEAKKAEKLFDGLEKGAIAVVVAVGGIVIALEEMVRETITAGKSAKATSKELGITAEEVQELGFAATRSNVSVNSLNSGIRSLERRSADARRGNKSLLEGFGRLGVKVTDANGKLKPVVQLFGEIADGFTKIKSEGDRASLAMTVAGDGGRSLLPLFLKGSKGIDTLRRRARVLGFVLENETVDAIDKVGASITDLGLLLRGLTRRIAVGLLPMVERLTNRTVDWFIANRELIDRGIKRLVEAVEGAIDAGARFIRLIEKQRIFLTILAGVLLVTLLPALLAVAGGYALVALAAIKAALVVAAPFIAIIAFAVLVALVIEDIFVFVSGGESAIGNLFDAFQKEAQKPGAHWLVRALFFIIKTIKDAIEAVDLFFKGFFEDALRLGGITEALKEAFSTAIDFWKDLVIEFGKFLGKKLAEFIGDIPIPGFLARFATGQPVFGAGGAPPRPLRPLGGPTTVTTNRIGPVPVKVTTGSGDPQVIGNAVREGVSTGLQDAIDEAHRDVGAGVF